MFILHKRMLKGDSAPGSSASKRKRKDTPQGRTKRAKSSSHSGTVQAPKNPHELAWKKVSLENDEFEDFEEIEGVDVEYVEKDGSKVIQFKVVHFGLQCS